MVSLTLKSISINKQSKPKVKMPSADSSVTFKFTSLLQMYSEALLTSRNILRYYIVYVG
jgi:hypothetical protein